MPEDNLEEIIKKKNVKIVERLEEQRLKKIELEKIGGIPQFITEDYTIKSGKYDIDHDIKVENATLTIEKGTTINFGKDKGIYIGKYEENHSQIISEGTKAEPIILQTKMIRWCGLRLENTKSDNILRYTRISGALKDRGGGINIYRGRLLLDNIILERCEAEYTTGGGINIEDSDVRMENASIIDNYANSCGGGIYVNNSEVKIINTFIKNNKASAGAGIDIQHKSNISLEDTALISNHAEGPGGGIRAQDNSKVRITNITVTKNRASNKDMQIGEINVMGGGIYIYEAKLIQYGVNNITDNTPNDIYEFKWPKLPL